MSLKLVTPDTPPPPADRFLPLEEVRKLTGLGTTSVYKLQKQGKFPHGVRIVGSKTVRWPESRVLSWIQQQIAAADAQAALKLGDQAANQGAAS